LHALFMNRRDRVMECLQLDDDLAMATALEIVLSGGIPPSSLSDIDEVVASTLELASLPLTPLNVIKCCELLHRLAAMTRDV
jgi:hypothetical protein